ncbi:MAG: outer membrane beta-barrel protein [Bacteroidales bacterium]|nr:outer membrane beta-barrel protein [Bacteroidales bacterium]
MKKSNKFKSIVMAAVLIACSATANAQLESGIYFDLTIPTGSFAKDVNAIPFGQSNIGKDAVVGIGATYRASYDFDIQVGHIAPFAEISLLWNRISSDNRDQFDKVDGSAPNYFNIPLMLGINYKYPLNELLQPYGEFGIGTDLFMTSKESFKGPLGTVKYKYSSTFNLCWQIGAGVIVGQYFSAGLTYMNMGRHKMKHSSSSDGGNIGTEKRSLGAVMVRLGFHF